MKLSHTITINIYRGEGKLELNPIRELDVPFVAEVKIEDHGIRTCGVQIPPSCVELRLTEIDWGIEINTARDLDNKDHLAVTERTTGECSINLKGSFGVIFDHTVTP